MNVLALKKKFSLLAVVFVVAFVSFVAYLTTHPRLLGAPPATSLSAGLSLDEGWRTQDGVTVDLSNLKELPDFKESGIVVYNGLPRDVQKGTSLNFISSNITFRVYFDDVLVYACNPDPSVFGQAYSTRLNSIPISSDDSQAVVRLEIHPVYSQNSMRIVDMQITDSVSYLQTYVRAHGAAFLESILIVFIGLAVIVLHVALRGRQRTDLDLLSLGAISVLMGVWSGIVTFVLQFITGLSSISGALEYASLLFVPYPVVRLASSLLRPRHRTRYEIAARIALVAAVVLTLVLSMAYGLDMHQLLIISHVQLVLCAVLVIMQTVSGLRRHGRSLRRGKFKTNRTIIIAFLVFIACSIADFILYNISSSTILDKAFFLRHGLFALAVVLAIEAFRTSMSYMRRAERAEAVEAIAYTDALTNIGNRSAWKAMRKEMDEALAQGQVDDALVCQFDVNYLKKINDTYGHAAGDDLIKRAADTINRSFGAEGACYRTGGDEFTALLVGVMLDERLHFCYDMFLESVDEQQELHESTGKDVPFSMAVGFACASETDKGTIKAAQALADERMYANKRLMKAERKD